MSLAWVMLFGLSLEDIDKMKSIIDVQELPARSWGLTDEQRQKLIKRGFDTFLAPSMEDVG